MKCKFALAALALLMTSSAASAFTQEQSNIIAVATFAQYAGLDDHCPRFKLNNSAMIRELTDVGLTRKDFESQAMSEARTTNFTFLTASYRANPSNFCNTAWQKFGPNGTYKRQMLEAR
jgi:hypothetical protein